MHYCTSVWELITNHEPIFSDSHWAHLIKEKTKEFVDVKVIFFPFIQHHVVGKIPVFGLSKFNEKN